MSRIRCQTGPTTLVLASTSHYRQELLARLGLPFDLARPDVDESPIPGETADQLVARLAVAKARAVADGRSAHLIIGSDQVACIDDRILGKPGSRAGAIDQLLLASGRAVTFNTGLALLNTASNRCRSIVVPYRVYFRELTRDAVERYVDAEQPLDCAGSFKSEGLGISLFERMEGDDPWSLIGLPLIALCDLLRAEGVTLP